MKRSDASKCNVDTVFISGDLAYQDTTFIFSFKICLIVKWCPDMILISTPLYFFSLRYSKSKVVSTHSPCYH